MTSSGPEELATETNGRQSGDNHLRAVENSSQEMVFVQEVTSLLDRAKILEDKVSAHSSYVRTESQALSQQALALDSEIKQLKRALNDLIEKDAISNNFVEKLEEDLYRACSMIYEGDVAALLPHKTNGLFLRLLLGPVNVRATRNDIRLKVKEEYNAYTDTTAVLFLAFPCVFLLLKDLLWKGCFPALPVQAYQAWLLLFYTILALRENILRINGSDIRPWWIYHHYFAMVTVVVSLMWGIQGQPSCGRKQLGVRLFLIWAIMQGITMLLQNHYQRQRLYTRIALGKISVLSFRLLSFVLERYPADLAMASASRIFTWQFGRDKGGKLELRKAQMLSSCRLASVASRVLDGSEYLCLGSACLRAGRRHHPCVYLGRGRELTCHRGNWLWLWRWRIENKASSFFRDITSFFLYFHPQTLA